LQQLHGGHGPDHGSQTKAKGSPLMIQGFRSNPKDPESHILFFDIEALIGISNFHYIFNTIIFYGKIELLFICNSALIYF